MCGEANFRAHIVGHWLLAVLWGLYVPLYCASFYYLTQKRSAGNRALSIVSTLTFTLCTLDMVAFFVGSFMGRNFICEYQCSGTICTSCGVETAQILREVNTYNFMIIIHMAIALVVQSACDVILIWRCFVIWNRKHCIVAFPIVCLLVNTGVWLYSTYLEFEQYLIRLNAPLSEIRPPANWIQIADLSITMGTVSDSIPVGLNVIVTSLIVGRIIWMTHDINKFEALPVRRKKNSTYKFLISIIVESGALLIVAYVFQLCTPYIGLTFNVMTVSHLTQIMGITPTLLLCLLALTPSFNTEMSNPVAG